MTATTTATSDPRTIWREAAELLGEVEAALRTLADAEYALVALCRQAAALSADETPGPTLSANLASDWQRVRAGLVANVAPVCARAAG